MIVPKKIKEGLRALAEEAPGKRFENRYHRVHHRGGNPIFHKLLFLVGGVLVVAVGIVLLPAPGPGMIVVAIGAGMIAQESLVVARALDRFEVAGRKAVKNIKAKWKKSSSVGKASALLVVACCAAGLAYGSFTLFENWRQRSSGAASTESPRQR